jgi:DHA2 family multidrug resistance protein-like MFS transporter
MEGCLYLVVVMDPSSREESCDGALVWSANANSSVAVCSNSAELNVAPSSSVWIVNAYQVAIMLALLPLSSAGDIIGYKRVYLWGLILFTAASLGCALSPSLGVLTLMRVVQGLGAAGVMSVNMALVRFIHPLHRLGHGIGINAVIIAVSAAIGPTIASSILAVAPWPWLFAIKVPIGIAAVALGYAALPDSPRASHAFDAISAALSALTFGMLVMVIDALSRPVPPLLIVGELAFMLASGIVLCRRQVRMPSPLLPVDLLRIPMFALSVGASACSFVAQTLAFIALPFHLEAIGYSAVDTGLLMTPMPLATAVLAAMSGKLSDRYAAGWLGLIGLAAFAAGLAALALVTEMTSALDIAWRMALAGAGFGLYQSPNNRTIQASAPRTRSGGASGMQAMARLIGQTVGAGLAALVFAQIMDAGLGALWLAVGFSLLGAIVSAVRLTDLPQS